MRSKTSQPGVEDSNPIIIFDGVCNMCNGFVNYLLKIDKKKVFLFTFYQSDAAKRLLDQFHIQEEEKASSIYLIKQHRLYEKSTAFLLMMKSLHFPWYLLYAFILLPKPFRNMVYAWIANNRYKILGKKDHCRILTDGEKQRFLMD